MNVNSPVRRRTNWLRYLGFVVAGMALGIFGLLMVGTYLPGTADFGPPLVPTLTGTVSVVDETGSKVCIVPDHDSEQWCSALYTQGPSRVNVGDRITVNTVHLRLDNGRSTADGFVIP